MKSISIVSIGLIALGAIGCSQKSTESHETDCLRTIDIKFGDPFVLAANDGRFYMYGTSLPDGFEAYVSDDMENWEPCGQVYHGGAADQWNVDCFWAPEVYERGGKYYMLYSANAKGNPVGRLYGESQAEAENFQIGVAVADNPAGPFKDLYNRPIFTAPYPVIDANVLLDDASGKQYLYFSRCCYKHPVDSEIAEHARQDGFCQEVEESWIYGVELEPDFSGIIGEPQLLLCPPTKIDDSQAEWESRSVTSREVNRRWTEGSFAFHYGNQYYIMYSANHYGGAHYAVGYATADNPLGPFTKAANNPVLQENVSCGGNVMGTGHNMVLTNPKDGKLYCVYHGRTSDHPETRVVFIDPIDIDPQSGVLTVGNRQ